MRGSQISFATAIATLVLALCCLLWVASLAGQGGSGEGGYIIIAQAMLGIFAFIILTFISLIAAMIASVELPKARWFLCLVVPMSGFAFWLLCTARVVKTEDTVGPKDIPRLIRSLQKDHGDDWECSVHLLAHLGPTSAPALAEALKHEDRNVRFGAAKALRDMAFRATAAIPALSEALTDPDDKVRAMAAEALGSVRPRNGEARNALPGLCKALNDKEWSVRFHAAVALSNIASEDGAHTGDAVPALAEALKHKDEFVPEYAAKALGDIGPAARPVAPNLAETATRGDKPMARVYAAQALWKVTTESQDAVANLVDLLEDKNEYVRREAATVLAEIGPPAASAVPVLRKTLKDQEEIVRRAAGEALQKIAPEEDKQK